MTLYTVLAPPAQPGEARPDALALVFVKEGFCWPALFVPLIWLIFRGLWLVLGLAILVVIGLVVLSDRVDWAIPLTIAALARLWFALEANGLRRWTYSLRGYRLIDVVEGRNLREAELRYFLEWPAVAPPSPPPAPETPAPRDPSPERGEVVGLFPSPGGAS